MAKNYPAPKRVVYNIDFLPEEKKLTLSISGEGAPERVQSFNLDILPLDMVMNNICQLLVPRNPNSRY